VFLGIGIHQTTATAPHDLMYLSVAFGKNDIVIIAPAYIALYQSHLPLS
jgi:hypothetical protein